MTVGWRQALGLALGALAATAADPSRFQAYLESNHVHKGQWKLPILSYQVYPDNYFEKVPPNMRPHQHKHASYAGACGENVTAKYWNAYQWQTEQLLTAVGLNIYDGSVWAIAMSKLGAFDQPSFWHKDILLPATTLQFGSIKGSNPCKGVEFWGQCSDKNGTGKCGLCYGNGEGNAAKTLSREKAYFFRMISDYWSLEGTINDLCPKKKIPWTWNDYKPVTGENSWASLYSTLHTAYLRAGSDASKIPLDCPELKIATELLSAFHTMQIKEIGAVFYSPRNTYYYGAPDIGSSVSTENNASLLGGLKMLRDLIMLRGGAGGPLGQYLQKVEDLITGIEHFLKDAYHPEKGFFLQGGHWDHINKKFTWHQAAGIPEFAADCQTWTASILGSTKIDAWYGEGTTLRLWETTKKEAGYAPQSNGYVKGIGFTNNTVEQVFSGEWTFGAINWLRVMANDSTYSSSVKADLRAQSDYMRQAINDELTQTHAMRGGRVSGESVKYASKRYFIPFGWWANAIPSTASTGWAVLADSEYNPFRLDGRYAQTTDHDLAA